MTAAARGAAVSSPCPLCGASARRQRVTEAGYAIVECLDCGLIFVDPLPLGTPDLDWTYGPINRAFDGDFRSSHQLVTSRALESLGRRYPSRGTLLDVGCGLGAFLQTAAEDGWCVLGLDVSQEAAAASAAACGRPVVCGSFTQLPFDRNGLNVVTLWNVLEHISAPAAALMEANDALAPNGTIVVRVPNMEFHEVLRRCARYVEPILRRLGRRVPPYLGGISPPRHVVGFTGHSLRSALEMTGFVNVEVRASRAHSDPWKSGDRSVRHRVLLFASRILVACTLALDAISFGRLRLSPSIEATGQRPS